MFNIFDKKIDITKDIILVIDKNIKKPYQLIDRANYKIKKISFL